MAAAILSLGNSGLSESFLAAALNRVASAGGWLGKCCSGNSGRLMTDGAGDSGIDYDNVDDAGCGGSRGAGDVAVEGSDGGTGGAAGRGSDKGDDSFGAKRQIRV